MGYQKVEELPQDLRDKLMEGSQQIYMTAFNSAEEDGMSGESADKVAWNSVRQYYNQSEDGKWYRRPQVTNRHGSMFPLGGS